MDLGKEQSIHRGVCCVEESCCIEIGHLWLLWDVTV